MASGSAGEGAGSNTDKKTSKVVMFTPPVFATSLALVTVNIIDLQSRYDESEKENSQ